MDAGGIALWILVILIAVNGIGLFLLGLSGKEKKGGHFGPFDVVFGTIEMFLIYLIIAGGYLP